LVVVGNFVAIHPCVSEYRQHREFLPRILKIMIFTMSSFVIKYLKLSDLNQSNMTL